MQREDLTDDGQRLLSMLVGEICDGRIIPDDPSTFVTYSEAHETLEIEILGGHAGRILQRQGLSSLADWCKAEELPAITGLMVSESGRHPGEGFFKLHEKRDPEDLSWWLGECAAAVSVDWSIYA